MEDLEISPWQIQPPITETNLFQSRQKSASKIQRSATLKDRFIQTQFNEKYPPLVCKQNFRLQSIQKKKLSSSTHQHFFNQPQCKRPSKLQLKLVAFPIQKIYQQRQERIRFTQKFEGKSNFLNQSFDVIETIFNSKLKLLKVFKQRPLTKYYTINESILLENRHEHKSSSKVSQSFDRLKNYLQYNYENFDSISSGTLQCKDQQIKFLNKNKQKMEKLQKLTKKQTSKQFISTKNHNLKLKNFDLPELNRTMDQKKILTVQQNQIAKYEQLTSNKLKQRQNKLSIQKLQNINCFRDTTNIFTELKKKNKVLFNQLEKYNLFGLKNLKNKNKPLPK